MQFFSRFFSRLAPGGAAATAGAQAAASRQKSAGARGASAPSIASSSSYEDSTPLAAQADRALRREHLYDIVRECMMRIGVPSTNYKFKVLALDSRGRQFLVMMDLANHALSEDQWNETEALLTQTAQARFDITVKAVYWRVSPQLTDALAAARAAAAGSRHSMHWQDVPVSERPTKPAALEAFTPRGRSAARSAPAAPVEADEMAALHQVIAKARKPDEMQKTKPTRRAGWQNKSALAGFEDTRLLLPDPEPGQGTNTPLGPTQLGDLN